MDKIEYRELIKSIKNRYLKKDYEGVIDLSDQLELERIREVSILEIVAKSYEALGRCDLAREALLIAYKRMPSGKRIAYNLAMLCIKLDDLDSAVMFYEDFCKIAPRDNQRLILKYEIGKAGGVPIKDLVRVLEVYNSREMDDKWEYELARLYHEMGDGEKCAATCDQVILWYANGEYEKKALQLKNMHKALTPEQQTRYEEIMAGILNDGATIVPIASKEEKAEAVEEMPAAESEADAAEAFASEQNAAEEGSNTAETEVPEAIETDVHENNKAEANVPTLEVPSEENWNKKRESAAEPAAQNPADQEIEYDTRHLGSEGEISVDNDNENIEGQMSVLSMIEAYKQKTVEDVDNKVGRDRAAQIMAEVASTHDSSALEEFEGDEAEFMQEGQVEVIEPEVPLFNREDVIEPADDGGEDLGERKAEFEFEKKSKTKQPVIEDEEVVDDEDEDSEYDDYDDEDDDYEEDIEDEEEDINDSAEDEPDEDEIDEDDYDDSDDEYEDDYDDEDDESEYDEEEYEEEEYRPVKTRSSRRKEKRRSMADDILADMVVDGGFTIEEEVEDDYDEEEDSEEELDEYDDDEAEGSENEHDDIETEDSEDDYDEDIEETEAECNDEIEDSEESAAEEETTEDYDETDIEEVEDEEPEAECNETDVEVEEADESEAAHDEAEIEEAEAETDDECEEVAALAEAAAEADVENDDIVIEDIKVEVECEEAEVEEPAAELEDADDECEDECGEADAEEFIDEYDEADAEDLEDEYPESEEDEDIADQVAAAFEAFDEGKTPKKNHKKVNPEKVIAGAAATAEQAAAGIGAAFGSLFKKNKKVQSEPERCEEDFIEEIDTPEGVFEVEREPEEVVVPRRGNKSQAKGKFAPEAPVSKEQVKAEKARIKAEKEKAKAEKAREKAEKIRKKAERLLAEKAKKEELAAARAAQEALEKEVAEQEVQPEEKKPKAKKAASSGELFQTVEPKKSTSVAKKATRAEAASAAEETVEAETVPAAEAALKKAVEEIKAEPAERIAEAKVTPAAQKIAEVEAAETKAEPEIQSSADEFNLDEFIKDEIGSEPAQSVKSKAAAAPQKEATAKADESANLAASIEEIVAKSAKSLSREQKHTAKPIAKSLRANVGFSSAVVTPAQGVARNAATVAAAQNMANPAAARLFAENPEPEVPSKDTASKLPKLVIPAFIKNRSSQKQSASLDSKSLDEILNSTIKDNDKKEEGFTVNVDELLDETIKADECKKSQMSEDLDGFNLDDFINPDGGEVQKNAAKKQAVFDEIFGNIEKDLKVKDEESKPKKATAAATQPLPKIQIQSPARKFGTGEYKLSREQKKELAEFLLIDGMEEEICSTIAKLVTKKKSGDETGGHLIVTGDAKTGKTFLTVEILKAVNQEVGRGNSRVAKVQAQAINGKNIMDILSKVKDSDLIIENIGRLEDDTVIELIQAVRASNAPTMIILEGNELAADTMIQNFPDIGKIFKTRINIGELTLTQWADLAQKYAASQGYSIDGMAQLALHAKIDQINTPDMRLGFKQVRQIIDDAIDKAEKRSSAKLFSAFGKKNDDELTPLMEDNFM